MNLKVPNIDADAATKDDDDDQDHYDRSNSDGMERLRIRLTDNKLNTKTKITQTIKMISVGRKIIKIPFRIWGY